MRRVTAGVDATSRWRPGPKRLARLLLGLVLFGAGEALLVASDLGNSPWTVLAEGVGEQTAIGVGAATVALSVLVLLAWIPLRQTPGLGTILNALIVGIALGLVLEGLSSSPGATRSWRLESRSSAWAAGSTSDRASALGRATV